MGKASGQFEYVTIRQLRPKRVIFAKFSDGLSEMDFTQPDPRHASVPTAMHTWITVKPLFGGARTTESTIVRTNLRRVTPFDERAGVKLGPLNVLEF